jgi:hypothetical protein
MGFRKKRVTFKAVVAILIIIGVLTLLIRSPHLAHGQPLEHRVQDVLLVIDNSGSMDYKAWAERVGVTLSDPEGRRFDAAKLVISYLAVDTIEGRRHYRVGIVSFGTDAILLSPLEQVFPGDVAERLRRDVEQERDLDERKVDYSLTNPHLALKKALQEMEAKGSFEQPEPPAIILITDGRFWESSFGEDNPEKCVDAVEEKVTTLAQKNGRLYVVLIGEAREDEAEWQRLSNLTGGTTSSLSDPEILIDVYHDLIRNLVGVEAFGVATSGPIQVRAGAFDEKELSLREEDYPYLDALIFTVFQTQPDIDVTFIQPNGQKLVPIPGKVEREGEQYVTVWRISQPQYGKWRVKLHGGSKDGQVQYWVDVRHATLQIQEPDPHWYLPPGRPVTIRVRLVSEEGIVKERPGFPIGVDVIVTRPDGHQTTDHMTKQDDDYTFLLKDTEQRGKYRLEFKVKWITAEGVETLFHKKEGSFKIAAVPLIKAILTEPPADQPIQAKEPLRLEASIENIAEQEMLQAFARVTDEHGVQVGGPVELIASETLPNVYSGELLFDKIGQYTVTVYLVGLSKEGIAYGPGQDIYIEQSFPVRVVTKTPNIKAILTEPVADQPIQAKEPLRLEASIENIAEQEMLQAFARVTDEHGVQVGGPVELIASETLPNVYSGELLFDRIGRYTVTVYLMGLSKGDIAYGPGKDLQIEQSFSVQVVTKIPNIKAILTEPPADQPIQAEESLRLEVSIENVAEQERFQAFAQVTDQQGVQVGGPVELSASKTRPNVYSGELLFDKTGHYTVTVYLVGLSKGDVAYGPDQNFQIEQSFAVQVMTEIPQLEEVRFQPPEKAIPLRQDVLIYAQVSKADKAEYLKVFAQVQGKEGEWPLQDDGVAPDGTAEDGVFTGRLPGFGRERLPGFRGEGAYVVALTLEGKDLTGESFSISQEFPIRVVASPLDWGIRGGIALVLLGIVTAGMHKWQEERKKAMPLGTLRILRHPPEYTGDKQKLLDSFWAKEVTLGLDDGLISLKAVGQWQKGLYARFYGREEGKFPQLPYWLWWLWGAEWLYMRLTGRQERKERVTYVEGLNQETPISVSGTPLTKGEKERLFEGSRVEVGGYTLEYLPPPLDTY